MCRIPCSTRCNARETASHTALISARLGNIFTSPSCGSQKKRPKAGMGGSQPSSRQELVGEAGAGADECEQPKVADAALWLQCGAVGDRQLPTGTALSLELQVRSASTWNSLGAPLPHSPSCACSGCQSCTCVSRGGVGACVREGSVG